MEEWTFRRSTFGSGTEKKGGISQLKSGRCAKGNVRIGLDLDALTDSSEAFPPNSTLIRKLISTFCGSSTRKVS